MSNFPICSALNQNLETRVKVQIEYGNVSFLSLCKMLLETYKKSISIMNSRPYYSKHVISNTDMSKHPLIFSDQK